MYRVRLPVGRFAIPVALAARAKDHAA